jgi:NADPH:quinone reductase-like Zn-dependent oxidoreductase
MITASGELRLSLVDVAVAAPGPDDVVVRVEAAPLNPSDLGLLLGAADLSTMQATGSEDAPQLTATVPAARMPAMAARVDQALPVGNEGAGTVIQAGANAQHLLGKRVGMLGGAMYAQYRTLPARDCIALPEGASAADGASMFVNPLTALAMTETMRLEGHTGLVHTAAASNLGQMLTKICLADGIPLVNVVRSTAQADLLRGIGATHVVDSSAENFRETLADALTETGATLCFDAIGGGKLANDILRGMETAALRKATSYLRYGSTTYKQVYVYGGLDLSPTTLDRSYGMAWGVGGFLLMNFLGKIGWEATLKLRERVARELTTTFSSHYSKTISLAELLDPAEVEAYAKRATGAKYLLDPSR